MILSLNGQYLKASGSECMDVSWSNSKAALSQEAFDGESASRQWYFQTCNEFGYYQTSSGKDNPFGTYTPRCARLNYVLLLTSSLAVTWPPCLRVSSPLQPRSVPSRCSRTWTCARRFSASTCLLPCSG